MPRKSVAARSPKKKAAQQLIPAWLVIAVVLVAVAMWVGSAIWSATHPTWPIPTSVHGVMMVVATGVIGVVVVRRDNGKNGGT